MPDQRKNIRRILWTLSTVVTIAAIAFSIYTLKTAGKSSLVSENTAAIYSLDINPSVEISVDLQREVIAVKSLNEEGKILLRKVNCMGIDITECIRSLIEQSVALGYLDAQDENYVLLSEIMLSEEFASLQEDIQSLDDASDFNVVFLAGNLQQKENADSKGISTGKEIFCEKAREIGIEIGDDELAEKSITELVNHSYEKTRQIFDSEEKSLDPVSSDPGDDEISATDSEEPDSGTPEVSEPEPDPTAEPTAVPTKKPEPTAKPTAPAGSYSGSHITGVRTENGSIKLKWDRIASPDFSGYKVVASATNPNPVYPADGYIRYISERDTNYLLVDSSFLSKLVPGTEYYFSITVLYGDKKVAGNSVRLKYLDESAIPDYSASQITGERLPDGSISLSWEKISSESLSGYKVVASATNPNPVYPNDGYIAWITDRETTTLIVDDGFCADFEPGTSYYFSITVLYCDHEVKVPGNSVYLQYK